MKGPCPTCGADTDSTKAKFCSECGAKLQQLQRNAESITCNGDDEGKPCMEKISLGKKFCPNCGRQVNPKEFELGNCQKCGENCPAASKMCMECLKTDASEMNARARLGKFGKTRIQTLTRFCPSLPSCERCGKKQLPQWTFCLYCGEKHRFKPREPEALGTEERTSLTTNDDRRDTGDSEETQSKMETKVLNMKLDVGSDECDDQSLINVLDQCGYSELMHLMEQSKNEWRDTKIQIAITGTSGSGISSLINALRGLKGDQPGAAMTGYIQTTMERKAYPHPDNTNLVLWDLPGVGTYLFPKETYIDKVCLNDYDFIIMVSHLRCCSYDIWLAETIQKLFPVSKLFFVRTQIDVDLKYIKEGRWKTMSDKELKEELIYIKQNCYDNLEKAGIINPCVFMVDNNDRSKFEFGKLADMLAAKVSALKKDALIRTVEGFTKQIVAAKYKLCIERMEAITKVAAIVAVESNRIMGERLEVVILKQEVMHYTQQLGIDTNSLDIVARRFGIDLMEMYYKLNSETHVVLRNFEQFYFKHDKVVPSNMHSLPFMGQYLLLRSYQKQCLSVLTIVLGKCIDENKSLQKHIAVWSLMPN